MAFVTPVVEHRLEREIAQWADHEGLIQQSIAPRVNTLTTVSSELSHCVMFCVVTLKIH